MTSLNAKFLAALLVVSAAAPALASEVDHRQTHQQARIAEGRESGQLTHHESARLERREVRMDRGIRHDRAADRGRMTRTERRHLHRQQDRVSRRIHRAKHDHRHA